MVFSSFTFLFLFLPLFLALYYLTSLPGLLKRGKFLRVPANLLLFMASLLFYAWGEGIIVLIMLLSTVIDYSAGLVISGALKQRGPIEPLPAKGSRSTAQKAALIVSISANLSLLGFFKYFTFLSGNLDAAFGFLGLSAWQFHDIIQVALPIGISFYTFQTMSYTIDVYRGVVPATRSFLDFATFVTMFPQLIAGPIVRYKDIAPSLRERSVRIDDFAEGVRRFVIGLGKKVLIADYLAVTSDAIFALPGNQLTTGIAWLGAICFTLQLYYDFSGYSDMAIGMGRMLGFRFLENFNYPYISRSFTEYWSRWHISLSSWFRDYLYYPLGGSRVRPARVFFNLFIVYILCGLWHGPSWTFILWGLSHGVFLLVERLGWRDRLARLWRPAQHLYFLLASIVLKVMFRSSSLQQMVDMVLAMTGFARGDGRAQDLFIYLDSEFLLVLAIGVLGSMPFAPWLREQVSRLSKGKRARPVIGVTFEAAQLLAVMLILCFSIMMIAHVDYTPFLYFRF